MPPLRQHGRPRHQKQSLVHFLLDSCRPSVHLWLHRRRMPHLQLPPAAREPTRRKGHGQRRRSTSRPVLPSTGATSRTTTHAIRLRRTDASLCAQLSRKQAAVSVGLCGCILLVGVIWALVVLICVLGFRGNKPGVVAKRFTGDEEDSITILPCVGSVFGPCLCWEHASPVSHVSWTSHGPLSWKSLQIRCPNQFQHLQNMVQDTLCPGHVNYWPGVDST